MPDDIRVTVATIHAVGSKHMDPYRVQLSVQWVFRDPHIFLWWVRWNLDSNNLGNEDIHPDISGRTKTVYLFTRFARSFLDRKCRIKTASYGALVYHARNDFMIELPEWVQALDQMEVVDPSRTFPELERRMTRWIQQASRLSRSDNGRSSTR